MSLSPRQSTLLPRFAAAYRDGDTAIEIKDALGIGGAEYTILRNAARDAGLIVPRDRGRNPHGKRGIWTQDAPFRADLAWLSGYRIAWERVARCAACGQAIALQARVQWQRRRGKAARLVHVACASVERSAS